MILLFFSQFFFPIINNYFNNCRAHEQYGYCQAGTSGIFTSEDRVVIGTPGPLAWRGTLYVSTVSDDVLNRDNTIYHAPMEKKPFLSMYSYLG